jgi:regulator of cell morphogenesis and NO signaling
MAPRRQIDPIAEFMQEHQETLLQLANLQKAAASLEKNGYSPEVLRRLVTAITFLDNEVSVHNLREEEALFPVLERYVEGPTGVMRAEHHALRSSLRKLQRAVNRLTKHRHSKQAQGDLCSRARSVVQSFVNHIHKENYILFPLVQKFLTKDALREVARHML